jgi:hypothetical protein
VTKPTIYLTCVPGGLCPDDVTGVALAADGAGLCAHISSTPEYLRHDMGLTSTWHHDTYRQHYPDGFELIWIDDPATDPRWQAALALNRAKAAAETKEVQHG